MRSPWADSKVGSVTLIALCQVAAMALWFSASAVVPALAAEYGLSKFAQAALTSGVQAGFVIGCLAAAGSFQLKSPVPSFLVGMR